MAVTGRTVNRYPIGFEVLTKGINVTHPVGQMAKITPATLINQKCVIFNAISN